MITALNVSEYFLKGFSEPEVGDIISNLKMQKLLYYAQGIHLAKHDTPLFQEEIIHWQYGPIVKEVYDEYKFYNDKALPIPKKVGNLSNFFGKEKKTIEQTYSYFGQYSAWVLAQQTHKEAPWKNTKMDEIITKESIKAFFKKELPRLGINIL